LNFAILNACREMKHPVFKTKINTPWGLFWIPIKKHRAPLKVICSPFDGSQEWEHVSASLPDRCPTWEEMCCLRELFWTDKSQCIVQFHPPEENYVNNARFCLHLWRLTKGEFPQPPTDLVGIKNIGEL
jgi:hypothetical protein